MLGARGDFACYCFVHFSVLATHAFMNTGLFVRRTGAADSRAPFQKEFFWYYMLSLARREGGSEGGLTALLLPLCSLRLSIDRFAVAFSAGPRQKEILELSSFILGFRLFSVPTFVLLQSYRGSAALPHPSQVKSQSLRKSTTLQHPPTAQPLALHPSLSAPS